MTEHGFPIDELDIDLDGFLEGGNAPDCFEEVFDLNGRRLD